MIIPFLVSIALAQTYPDPKLTPGAFNPAVTQETIKKTICKPGYTATIRNVSEKTKKEVFKRYGFIEGKYKPGDYEIDHFLSLEISGSNDINNLWPQAYLPKPGAREKDVTETHLHKSICSGKLTLGDAQRIMLEDWYKCYLDIKAKKECEAER
jgi:hypothetical protein